MAGYELLLHPIRFRIVQEFLAGGELTTDQVHSRLDGVPLSSLYRHISELLKNDILHVVRERAVRGTTEKTYELAPESVKLTAAHLSTMSPDDLLGAFTMFLSGIIADFDRYVHRPEANILADGVGFSQVAFYATAEQFQELTMTLKSSIERLLPQGPGPDRERRTLTTVFLPDPGGDEK
ncbi:helix-turn-helix domain-containing protein [Klugiella xanthotipulae]|uniref:Helix-turn-helix protein n=1 Tax=Klugiella xanthotipulae TaxID=244735 RepID=A0A543HSG5_9MICO|nr:helix-turn-helix domain-containing protein [Klugiella xanthotipulae]TQM61278.1 helix-turn-helix protein [Klugiella xanthotipulae]